jgi:hypothetical protein
MGPSKPGEPIKMSDKRVLRPYSEAETARLRELFAAGYSDLRIAHELGRKPSSVSSRRAYLGLYRYAYLTDKPSRLSTQPTTKWTHAQLEQLADLVGEGRTDHEIAAILNRPKASVGGKRRQLGLKTARPQGRPRTADASKIEAVRARIAAGERVADIAPELGMRPSSLHLRLRVDHSPTA